MPKKDQFITESMTEPFIKPPKPKFEFFLRLLTLAVGVFTAIKVVEISRHLTDLEDRGNLQNAGAGTDIKSEHGLSLSEEEFTDKI